MEPPEGLPLWSGFSSDGLLGDGGSCNASGLEAAEDGWSIRLGLEPGCCARVALPDMPPTRTTSVQKACQRLKVPQPRGFSPLRAAFSLEQAHSTSVSVELIPASLVRDVCDAPDTDILVRSPFSLTPVPGSPTIMPLTEVEPSNRVGRA